MAYVRHIQANGSDAGMREPWGMYTELARKHGLDQEMGSRGSLGVSEAGGSRAGAAISGAGALKSRLISTCFAWSFFYCPRRLRCVIVQWGDCPVRLEMASN